MQKKNDIKNVALNLKVFRFHIVANGLGYET
jgi:hypothetical protein